MILTLAALAALQPPTGTPPSATPAAPAKEKKICHQSADIGSIVPHKTCHTKAEWDAISNQETERTRFESRQMQSAPGQNPQ